MNNEIKEILDRLFVYRNENDEMKYEPEDMLITEDIWLLLDYITNLQQEIQKKDAYIKYLETRVPKYKGKKFYGIEGDGENEER